MKEKSKKLSAIMFFTFICILPLITLFSKKEKFSEIENRTLASFPRISFSSIFRSDFMDGFQNYIADHFIFRADWVKLKTEMELMSGKTEINGVYMGNSMYIEKLQEPDYTAVDKSVASINKFAGKTDIPVYVMAVPTSACIYTEERPKHASQFDQKAFIDYIYSGLDKSITTLDVYTTLNAVRDEYIYYRNDHHWTTLGAYYAYNYAIGKLGFNSVSYDKFDIEHANSKFRGTLYSKVLSDRYAPDIIDMFIYEGGSRVQSVTVNDGMNITNYDSMYFREYLDKKDKYSVYFGGNFPLVTIKTNVNSDKKILVIKDSYANCFVPFLTQHYSEISMVDMRKLTSLKFVTDNYIDFDSYSQVLILYNAETLSSDEDLKNVCK